MNMLSNSPIRGPAMLPGPHVTLVPHFETRAQCKQDCSAVTWGQA